MRVMKGDEKVRRGRKRKKKKVERQRGKELKRWRKKGGGERMLRYYNSTFDNHFLLFE